MTCPWYGTCRDPGHFLRDLGEHLFGKIHQVTEVAVGLVELQHREFRVVMRGDPLVAEDAAQLVDPREPADDEPLEVELERDPQVEIDVERVVVGRERPGQGSAGDRLQHRCFHFEIAALVQECGCARMIRLRLTNA